MWQSQVEIEHYSVAYFNHITELLLRVGLIRAAYVHEYLISLCSAYELCPYDVWRYDNLIALTQSKYATDNV